MTGTASSDQKLTFGTRLQTLRRDCGLTQIDLSSLSKLSKSYISFLESGVRKPSREAVLKLAQAIAPGDAGLRDDLLVLAGFMPKDALSPLSPAGAPAYSRRDFRRFLQHSLQLIRDQNFTQAEKEIEAGFLRFRRPAQMQTLLAHLELARGAFEQAILFQQTAIKHFDLSPDEQDPGLSLVDFILNLGVMYYFWGDQARYAADTDIQATNRFFALARERYALALDTFETGLHQAPGHVYLLDELGRIHFNLADLDPDTAAKGHWEASIRCFRQVLSHPEKHLLAKHSLRESAAFLGLAYAKRGQFSQAELLLDALSLDPDPNWQLAYIQACTACLAYREKPDESLLDRALAALKRAEQMAPIETRAQLKRDQFQDLAPLFQHKGHELAKGIPSDP
ncbi:MAG: hypothetical protein CVV27_01265 [Candidatus Melainabacteria bacterium HGW-Melainabacteria-1]|nr:MAG: hypothetical protein CVV27_01265 [Candidatus Melainabacteria bacterium HGW-Melainabacteria-1]